MLDVPEGSLPLTNPDSNVPYVFRQWMLGHLEGKLLTLVEAFGFEEKRERAAKSLVRNTLWDWCGETLFRIDYSKINEFEDFLAKLYPQQGVASGEIKSSKKVK